MPPAWLRLLGGVAAENIETRSYSAGTYEGVVRAKNQVNSNAKIFKSAGPQLFGKAGAYGIQGRAAAFVAHISGSYSGIMGLPLFETAALLAQAGITLKFEDPSPVGSKKALTANESGGERFPHLYAGIPPAGVVVQEFVVRRGAAGEFLSIDGLCSADPAAAPKPLAPLVVALSKRLQQMLPAPPALACGCVGAAVGFAVACAMAKGRAP